ncbi:aminoglycoside phosphotransferase [Vibrio variabilis]|uniref:Aminoglycoside phosphotransferase n=1 Tax=Vibrio variabilis TaxID=990271 RepID=A0ABQ0JHH8_9VIBR|nr:aminoglycoside phosphotransferase [Vibrio variabilis]
MTINAALERAEERLEHYHSKEKYGLVHADLRLANLIINGDELLLIDFDDCGYCWYMYDFAASISFYELDPSIPELQKAWVTGYNRVTPLPQQDVDEINTFILLRRVLLTAWLATHSDTPTAEELGEGFARGTVELAERFMDDFGYSEEVDDVA